jgi:hypothetical protein
LTDETCGSKKLVQKRLKGYNFLMDFQEKLSRVPASPGIYIMKGPREEKQR